jgi:hypothetical protein
MQGFLQSSISIYLGWRIYIVLYLYLIIDFVVTIVLTRLLEARNLCSVASHGRVPSRHKVSDKWSGRGAYARG